MPLSTIIRAGITAEYTSDQGLYVGRVPLEFSALFQWADGVLAGQADKIFIKRDSVANGAPDTFDLAGGLTDPFGVAFSFAKICGIGVLNRNTVAGEILSVGGGTNPFINWVMAAGDGIKLGPGGLLMQVDPSLAAYAVTGGTGDVLQIAAAAGTIGYDLMLIGRSA